MARYFIFTIGKYILLDVGSVMSGQAINSTLGVAFIIFGAAGSPDPAARYLALIQIHYSAAASFSLITLFLSAMQAGLFLSEHFTIPTVLAFIL